MWKTGVDPPQSMTSTLAESLCHHALTENTHQPLHQGEYPVDITGRNHISVSWVSIIVILLLKVQWRKTKQGGLAFETVYYRWSKQTSVNWHEHRDVFWMHGASNSEPVSFFMDVAMHVWIGDTAFFTETFRSRLPIDFRRKVTCHSLSYICRYIIQNVASCWMRLIAFRRIVPQFAIKL